MQLLDRKGGAVLRSLWHAIVAHLEETQARLAAARELHDRGPSSKIAGVARTVDVERDVSPVSAAL
jgi:signal transduction histidine kinase